MGHSMGDQRGRSGLAKANKHLGTLCQPLMKAHIALCQASFPQKTWSERREGELS